MVKTSGYKTGDRKFKSHLSYESQLGDFGPVTLSQSNPLYRVVVVKMCWIYSLYLALFIKKKGRQDINKIYLFKYFTKNPYTCQKSRTCLISEDGQTFFGCHVIYNNSQKYAQVKSSSPLKIVAT